jgi:hypothetical protein
MFHMLKVGHLLRTSDGDTGKVVANITCGDYSEEFPDKDWAYLKNGILITFDKKGLVHFPDEQGLLQEFVLNPL